MATQNAETVADILRPLVEQDDPRFKVLRGSGHILVHEEGRTFCGRCGYESMRGEMPDYCIHGYLGSIVRAAAACGIGLYFRPHGIVARPDNSSAPLESLWYTYESPTPELAAARALVAAVEALSDGTS